MSILRTLRLLIDRPAHGVPISPGLYHYLWEVDGAYARFHLRVDPSGAGLLLANALAAARLNVSGVFIAKGLFDGESDAALTARVQTNFRGVQSAQVALDIAAVRQLIERLAAPDGQYPILNLVDPAFSPKAVPLERPLSADVPLCAPERMTPILDRLWQLGIPHVTVIAGSEPDETALVRAVERAEDLGLITGIRGRGSDLMQGDRIARLARVGLDHLDLFCLSIADEVHDALAGTGDLQKTLAAFHETRKNEVCAVAQVALVRATWPTIHDTLAAISARGLRDVCMCAIATTDPPAAAAGAIASHELVPAARQVEETAERLGLRLLWYPPVQFDPARPLRAQILEGPRCSGDTAIRVEPDGAVVPPRGPRVSAGNLLRDDWKTIAQSAAFQNYRRRVESDTHCDACPGLTICAADCPRNPAGWATE